MERDLIFAIMKAVLNVGIILLIAPFFQGVLRKVTACIQSRQGPPIWQPYYDLLKLLGKEDIESGETPIVQRFAAYLSFASILTLACFIPMGYGAPLNLAADVVLLVYLLTLCSVCTLLAGLAAGSTYSLIGVSREMMSMITLEPIFAVAIVAGVIHTQSFQLNSVLSGSPYATAGIPWSGAILALVMLFSMQAYVQRVPFDMSEAETEIMEGALIEYSGPKLALFKYAQMAKLVIYSALFIALFAPWGSHLPLIVAWLLFWAKVFVLVLLVTLVAATHARYRIDQAIRYFATLLGISFMALALASFGY